MKLYHGSNISIDEIDLSKGHRGKDFGQGFYLSDNFEQARMMAEKVTERQGFGKPTINKNDSDKNAHDFDIVVGPIANDVVGVQLTRHLYGYIDIQGLVNNLKFITPTIQYFFGTEESLKYLKKYE